MPLLVVCGLPSRGKTTRAAEVAAALAARGRPAARIADDGVDAAGRRAVHGDVAAEKRARATLLSAVERLLAPDVLVIADALNDIKGVRYQLSCIARACATPHAVLEVAAGADEAARWDAARSTDGYGETLLRELEQRYEAPNSMARWDRPLFVVATGDALPLDALDAALFGGAAPTPHLSTRTQPVSEPNYVFLLDQTTQQVVSAIVEAQRTGATTVPGTTRSFETARPLSWAELHRHRRQFLALNRLTRLGTAVAVADAFLDYVQRVSAG